MNCQACGHPDHWHRHDDEGCLEDHVQPCHPTTTAFRCIGYDVDTGGVPRAACSCEAFVGDQMIYETGDILDEPAFAVTAMLDEAERLGIKRLAVPRLGCGLGGMAWPAVEEIIQREAAGRSLNVVLYAEGKGDRSG